jgi:hypothetical protein
MGIATQAHMDTIEKLIEDIQEYAHRYPEQQSFAEGMLQTVERIRSGFDGDTRDGLLAEARSTLECQKSIHENSVRTLAALEKLKKNQQQLLRSLVRAAAMRPPGVTLH